MKHISKKRLVILLVSVAALLAVSVGVTLAYVFTETDPVENRFEPSKVACAVVEDGSVVSGTQSVSDKKNVQIKNTGDTDAYIRVAVVVTWKSTSTTEPNTVLATKPTYKIDLSDYADDGTESVTGSKDTWVKYGDYYYFTKPIAPDATTDMLFDSISSDDTVPEGFALSVEIVASAIQAEPTNAVQEAWGVTIANGSVTAVTTD